MRQGDAVMRTYRRDPSSIQDYAMLGQDRVRRLGEEDHADNDVQTHIWRRLADQEDVNMGLINYID